MDADRELALLRLYAGDDPTEICADLGITRATLELWERTTPTSELRPPGLESFSAELRSDRASAGVSIKRPEWPSRPIGSVVHEVGEIVAGEQRCRRCGMVLPLPMGGGSWEVGAQLVHRVNAEGNRLSVLNRREMTRAAICQLEV